MGSLSQPNGKTVLISGINGYIASVIGLDLLQKGYNVRGTARKVSSTDPLVNDVYKHYADRFEAVSVPDMTAVGAFDEAVKGVHAIMHTASPIDMSLTTLEEFMVPAIGGATGILESALKHAGTQLESVVVTSSVAAVSNMAKPADHSFTEADWNDFAEKAVATMPNPPVMLSYAASKNAAEKAIWEWRDKNQPPFAITAINPSVVTGPPVNPPSHPSALNETLKPIWSILSGAATKIPAGIGSESYIDVRDVSAIHIYAAEHPTESNGHRFLCAAGRGTMQAAADILRAQYTDRGIVVGEPGSGYEADYGYPEAGFKFYSTRTEKALGRGLIKYDRSVLDTAAVLERYF